MLTEKKIRRKQVYTTTDVARVFGVAPRTITKSFDSGILRGFRIPGSRDRRVPHEELIRFLRVHNCPIPPELTAPGERANQLLVGSLQAGLGAWIRDSMGEAGTAWSALECLDAFSLGLEFFRARVDAVVIDLRLGRDILARSLEVARSIASRMPVVALIGEDEDRPGTIQSLGCDAAFCWPCSPASVAAEVLRLVAAAPQSPGGRRTKEA